MVIGDQYILRFDVVMNDFILMKVVDTLGDLQAVILDLVDG